MRLVGPKRRGWRLRYDGGTLTVIDLTASGGEILDVTERATGIWVSTGALLLATALSSFGCDGHLPLGAVARQQCASVAGTWLIVSPAGLFGDRVAIFSLSADSAPHAIEVPSLSSSGVRGLTFLPSTVVASATCDTVRISGALQLSDGAEAAISYTMQGDTGAGTIRTAMGLSAISAMRFDASLLVGDSGGPGVAATDSTPAVLLRIDDATDSDRGFLPRVASRGLVAELAIPTYLVGDDSHLTWNEVSEWASRGFGIAAHSRWHGSTEGAAKEFLGEVTGSFTDLMHAGLRTPIFVQPGTWTDSAYFDAPAKLATWRGAVLRNFAVVFEAYEPPSGVPEGRKGTVPFGVSHATLSGLDSTDLLHAYRRAFAPGTFTIFMVHTRNLGPLSSLDWVLDSLAAAGRKGRLLIVSSSLALLSR